MTDKNDHGAKCDVCHVYIHDGNIYNSINVIVIAKCKSASTKQILILIYERDLKYQDFLRITFTLFTQKDIHSDSSL